MIEGTLATVGGFLTTRSTSFGILIRQPCRKNHTGNGAIQSKAPNHNVAKRIFTCSWECPTNTHTDLPLVINITFTVIFYVSSLHLALDLFPRGYLKKKPTKNNALTIRIRLRKEWDKITPVFLFHYYPIWNNKQKCSPVRFKVLDHVLTDPWVRSSKTEHMSRIFIPQHLISELALGSRDTKMSLCSTFVCFSWSASSFYPPRADSSVLHHH